MEGQGPWSWVLGCGPHSQVEVEMKVLGWVFPEPSPRQGLGAESPFGKSQETGAREWGSDTKIMAAPFYLQGLH